MKNLLTLLVILLSIASAQVHPATPTPTNFLNTTPTVLGEVSGTTFTEIVLRPNRDVWAASLDAIIRYDGHGVESYKLPGVSTAGLPVARIAELFLGPAQRIWVVGFDGGLFKFNPDAGQFRLAGSVDVHASRLVEAEHDGETGLWLGFSDGSCVAFDIEMETAHQRCQGMDGAIIDFAFDSASVLILSEDGTVLRLNANRSLDSDRAINQCSLTGTRFTEILAFNKEFVLLGTHGGGLFKCPLKKDGNAMHALEPVNAVSRKSTIHQITVAKDNGRVFVATDSGLDVLDGESLRLLYSSRYASDLVNTEFTALALQGSDTIWVSSFAGIYRLHASDTVVTKDLPGNPTPSIVGFSRLGERLVIADYAGLYFADQRELGVTEKSNIQHICDVSGGITAVTTWRNQIVYGLRSGGVFKLPHGPAPRTCGTAGLIDSIGPISTVIPARDTLLIGTFGNGAYRFDTETGLQQIEVTKRSHLARRRVLHIEQISSLGFLLLTEGGILVAPIKPSSQAPLLEIANLLEGTIPWAASTFEDHLWLATPTNGVYAVSLEGFPSRKPRIAIHHELPGEIIQAVEAVSSKEALVSSKTSIFRLSINGSVEHAFNAAGNTAVRFDFGASFRDQSGVLFGGTGGYANITSKNIRPQREAPQLRITSYAIDDKEFPLYRPLKHSDKVLISADKQRLTLNIGSLAPWAAYDFELRYRLEGFDSEWSHGKLRNEVTYTNLPPGLYEFKSQARIKGGMWNSAALSLTVEVLPPWWRSIGALLFYTIATGALLTIAKHYYGTILVSRRATQLAREMTATAEQAIEDMQDEVETQARLLESVTRRNVATLSWIGEVVGRQADTLPDALSSEMAKVSLERIDAFVCLEHTLRYRDDRVLADLRSFTDECSAMLLASRSQGSTITLINEVSDTLIDAEHAARLATVIYELLANALDHAFAGREYGNFLRVALELTPEPRIEAVTTSVTVEDNGIGLPEGVSLEAYETSGFSLIREVTAYYGGRLVQKTTSGGTSLRVDLPLPEDAVV